jgi:hypothetical protein
VAGYQWLVVSLTKGDGKLDTGNRKLKTNKNPRSVERGFFYLY